VVVSVVLDDAPRHVLEEIEIEIEPDADPGDDDGEGPAAASVAFSLVPAVGGSALGSTFLADEPDAVALVPSLLAQGRTFVPALEAALVGAHRVCARPQSRDGRPLIGAIPGTEGLWVAAGHGPWGISTGPASGRLVADLITGREAAPPPAVDPARFEAPLGR
jgi:glycine/D-amino acid oxidase-like deaminating enzyme